MSILTVNDSSLTALANAIREKREIQNSLLFPDDFIAYQGGAVENVSAEDLSQYQSVITGDVPDGVTVQGFNFQFSFKLIFQFLLQDGKTIEDYTFLLDESQVTPTFISGTTYRIEIDVRDVSTWNMMHSINITDGVKTWNRTYSVLSYLYSKIKSATQQSFVKLCKAMYIFYLYERNHFG